MGAISYIQPSEQLTQTDRKESRINAMASGIVRAYSKSIGNPDQDYPTMKDVRGDAARVAYVKSQVMAGNPPASLDIREMQPILDAVTVLDQWNTAALAVVGAAYSVFQAVPAPANPNNRIIVFYKVGIETPAGPVSRLLFRSGGAAGNTLAVFDLEQILNSLVVEGYFSEPVVIDPAITYAVQVLARIATGLLARVQLGNFVIEPNGQTIA